MPVAARLVRLVANELGARERSRAVWPRPQDSACVDDNRDSVWARAVAFFADNDPTKEIVDRASGSMLQAVTWCLTEIF
jgi:hypothetical protein